MVKLTEQGRANRDAVYEILADLRIKGRFIHNMNNQNDHASSYISKEHLHDLWNNKNYRFRLWTPSILVSQSISTAFSWWDSPEGYDFWHHIKEYVETYPTSTKEQRAQWYQFLARLKKEYLTKN